MSIYAIGDIHGCFEEFQRLLEIVDFDAAEDRIWHVGDLVNGGPQSLETVRWFKDHDQVATSVLGNHDLHLIAVALGVHNKRSKDTFDDILLAPDRGELIDWLRQRPLLVVDKGRVLVHAGLLPQWSVAEASELARQVEELLTSSKPEQLLEVMYGNNPKCCDDVQTLEGRWRLTINAMTRMRVLEANGDLNFSYKSTYEDIPPDKMAWFDADQPAWADHQIICGHWSALGLHRTERITALDTGCRWGGKLSAYRLDDEAIFEVDAG